MYGDHLPERLKALFDELDNLAIGAGNDPERFDRDMAFHVAMFVDTFFTDVAKRNKPLDFDRMAIFRGVV